LTPDCIAARSACPRDEGSACDIERAAAETRVLAAGLALVEGPRQHDGPLILGDTRPLRQGRGRRALVSPLAWARRGTSLSSASPSFAVGSPPTSWTRDEAPMALTSHPPKPVGERSLRSLHSGVGGRQRCQPAFWKRGVEWR